MNAAKTVPRRTQTQHHHHGHQRNPSHNLQGQTDYETDTLNPSDTPGIHPPQLPHAFASAPTGPPRSVDELNLSVLQRYNTSIASVEAIAPYAVLYTFSSSVHKWEKCNVEGSLFICKLEQDPTRPGAQRFAAVILNRRGLENFAVYLEKSQDVEVTDDYVILQVHGDHSLAGPNHALTEADELGGTKVYGLWIFSEADTSTAGTRAYIADIIVRCVAEAESSGAATEQSIDTLQYAPGYGYRVSSSASTTDPQAAAGTTGRQLSLQKLFEQQQNQNTVPNVSDHPNTPSWHTDTSRLADTQMFAQTMQPHATLSSLKGIFPTDRDTNFLQGGPPADLTAIRDGAATLASQNGAYASEAYSQDLLGELFRKASHGAQ